VPSIDELNIYCSVATNALQVIARSAPAANRQNSVSEILICFVFYKS